MNYEQYEAAKHIRSKREQIDQAIERQNAARGPGSGLANPAAQAENRDSLTQGITLQSQLNDAIAAEDFALAAELRDKVQELKDKSEAAELLSSEWDIIDPIFCLGQRVMHTESKYQAVVVGWDRTCCETSAWQAANGVSSLSRGLKQAFYHVVIDSDDWRSAGLAGDLLPVAYVPEERLEAPAQKGATWKQEYSGSKYEKFRHPFEYMLFLGSDNHGDFIPTPDLRNTYNEQRRDVYPVDDNPDSA